MIKTLISFSFTMLLSISLLGQEQEKIKVISRAVEGEVRTLYNDTLYGKIKVLGAQDYYITSIEFKAKGKRKAVYSAEDIKRFKMIVPFPDRPNFGVDEVYYEAREIPEDTYRKAFYPIEEWK